MEVFPMKENPKESFVIQLLKFDLDIYIGPHLAFSNLLLKLCMFAQL